MGHFDIEIDIYGLDIKIPSACCAKDSKLLAEKESAQSDLEANVDKEMTETKTEEKRHRQKMKQ